MRRKIVETTIELSGKEYHVKIFSPDKQGVFRVVIGLVVALYFKKEDPLGWIDIRKNRSDELSKRIGKMIERKGLG